MTHANSTIELTPPRHRRVRPVFVVMCITTLAVTVGSMRVAHWPRPRIGATAIVTEVSTGLLLEARVDTGAAVCSIHCEEIRITNESPNPDENIGGRIRFRIRNRSGEAAWVETRIVDHNGIQTASSAADRYFVHLGLQASGVEKTVLVTLNDRSAMKYPLLVGRNFLRDDFVVDVNLDRGDGDFD